MCIRRQSLPAKGSCSASALITACTIMVALPLSTVAKSSECPELSAKRNLVVIAGQGDTGSRGIAYLLDRMGVFIVTGDRRCNVRSEKACQRRSTDKDTLCSDQHLDFHIVSTRNIVSKENSFCYDARGDTENIKKLEDYFHGIDARLANCKGYGDWKDYCPPLVGVKNGGFLSALPLLHQMTDGRVKVLHLVRDGRDQAIVRNQKSFAKYAKVFRLKFSKKNKNEGEESAAAWQAINLGVDSCGKKLLGPDNFKTIRIEDFVLSPREKRADVIQSLATWLGINTTRVPMDKLLDTFETPIDK